MLIFGLLLLLLAAAVITYMILATNGMADIRLDYGILNLDLPPLWLFLAGALTVAVAAIGLWLMAIGARSKARRAKEVRELRKQAKTQDRRVERADDATIRRPGAVPPGPSTTSGTGLGSTAPRTTGTTGTTADRSSLDLDR